LTKQNSKVKKVQFEKMASLNFDRHSLAPLKTIKEVQFGLFSPEEVAGMSVAHIQYPETIVS